MHKVVAKRLVCGWFTAVILLVLGITTCLIQTTLLEFIIATYLPITPETPVFAQWADTPAIRSSYYLFNVTNAEEVRLKGAKPKLEECGPYVFNEFHHKVKIVENTENATVTYQQYRSYFFDEESTKAAGADYTKDRITTLNAVVAGVNAAAKLQPKTVQGVISFALDVIGEKLFVTKSPKELLFEGYKDPVLTDTKWLPDSVVPQKLDRFAYFWQRNGTTFADGVFNMNSGIDDIRNSSKVNFWNYSTHHFFDGKCGEVRGNGDFFSPWSAESADFLEMYQTDLCRPLRLDHAGHGSIFGVFGKRFNLSENFFSNKKEENQCYNGGSLPDGTFNASVCRFGAPVYLSQPHYYQADPYYIDQLEAGSLFPDAERHGTTFLVEPMTGLPIDVAARFQVNFMLEPLSTVGMFKHFKSRVFIPTMWSETVVQIPKPFRAQLWLLSNLPVILVVTGYSIMGLAVAGMTILIIFHSSEFLSKRVCLTVDSRSANNTQQQNENLLENEEETAVESEENKEGEEESNHQQERESKE